MSVRAITDWVWSLEELGVSETLVLLALADRADGDGLAWSAQGDLARRVRQTDRNVRRVLGRLERLGLLRVERRSSRRGRRPNLYHLSVGARVCGLPGSRQEDRLSGCGGGEPAGPAGGRAEQEDSAGVAATGQFVRLRRRTGCPVAQEDAGVRLHSGGDGSSARTGPVGDAVPAARVVGAAALAGAGARRGGGAGSRPGLGSVPEGFSKASGASDRGSDDEARHERAGVREAVAGEPPLVQAAVVEARRAGALAGVDVAGVVARVRERAGRRVGVLPGGPGRG